MLAGSPAPAGGWPAEDLLGAYRGPFIRPDQVGARYNAVVVGSGAGGGVAAWALAQSDGSLLLVERSDYPVTAYLARPTRRRSTRPSVSTRPGRPQDERSRHAGVRQSEVQRCPARTGRRRQTMLAVALAVAVPACQAGFSIYFTTLDDLVRRLRAAEATGRFNRQLQTAIADCAASSSARTRLL
jgi:choline dehydrogenase-like flavoprotein